MPACAGMTMPGVVIPAQERHPREGGGGNPWWTPARAGVTTLERAARVAHTSRLLRCVRWSEIADLRKKRQPSRTSVRYRAWDLGDLNMATKPSETDAVTTDFRSLPLEEMQAIVSRFEKKVSEIQLANPPSREAVRKTIRRQGGMRCPVHKKRFSTDTIIRYGDALADLFATAPDDLIAVQAYEFSIGYQPRDRKDRVRTLEALMRAAEWTDEWGTRWGHAFGGVGATPVDYPIKDWAQLDDYLAQRIPDPHAPGRLDRVKPSLALHGETKYCVGVLHLMLFERLHCLRGMENVFVDFYTNEREVRRLLEALAEYFIGLIGEWANTPTSALFLTDDWGSQTGLMVSADLWRKYFKAHYRRIFDEVHRTGKEVIFHSCGNVTALIPDLIELGVDALDPVQPEAMDLKEVGRQFGGHITFCGAITDQRLEDYTPQQVREMVARTIDTLGRPFGNAYIVAASNVIPPSAPFENLEAFFQAAHAQ